jgi:phosphatidyl-myo-inositol dimannoside synthase
MICFVTHEFAPFRGGIATYVREVAAAAEKLGYPVRVIAPDYGLVHQAGDDAENFPIDRVPGNGRLTPAGILSMARALRARREEWEDAKVVLLSPGAQMAMMITMSMGRLSHTSPIVPILHGSEVLRYRRHPLWRVLSSRFFPRTRPACSSRFVMRLAHESGLIPREVPITLAPCACPTELLASAHSIKSINPRTQTTFDEFRLLTLARFHPRKGQVLTARALGMLPPEFKKRIHYEIVGDGAGDYRAEVERACSAAGIRHTIRKAAAPDELASIYAACDAFIMTSVQLPRSVEGFGISYLEASAFAKPVVAFRSGGVEEAVLSDQTGLLVTEGDLAGVAAAVQRLMSEPELRRRLGQAGREFAASLSWNEAARAVCES